MYAIIAGILFSLSFCGSGPQDQTNEQSKEKVAVAFKRLYRLNITVMQTNNAIVQTIKDEATAEQAAKNVGKLFPLKAEIRYLERALRDFGLGPDQQLYEKYKQQRSKLSAAYVKLAVKVKDQPYFDTFNTSYVETSRRTTTLKPYSIPAGHAQRGDGPQFVIWLPAGAKPEIDLSDEKGTLEVFVVDESTGKLHPQRENIPCGGKAFLPPSDEEGSLYWLRPVDGLQKNYQDGDLTGGAPKDTGPISQIAQLLETWKRLPRESDEIAQKIRTLHKEFYKQRKPNTESHRQASQQLAAICWPHVLDATPKKMAQAIVDLTKPDAAVRMSDRLGEQGRPTEPLCWDVQATHALALARAEKFDEALKENEALLKKIEVNVMKGRLPDAQLKFLGATRSQKSLLKQTLLQKTLILSIAGKTAESVDASTAAGGVDVSKPTEADQQALQAMLLTLAEVQEPALTDFSGGMKDVTFVRKEKSESEETFFLKTKLNSNEFDANLRKHLGAGWKTRVLNKEDMVRTALKGRSLGATVNLSAYTNAKFPGVDVRAFHLTYKSENTKPNVEITVVRPDSKINDFPDQPLVVGGGTDNIVQANPEYVAQNEPPRRAAHFEFVVDPSLKAHEPSVSSGNVPDKFVWQAKRKYKIDGKTHALDYSIDGRKHTFSAAGRTFKLSKGNYFRFYILPGPSLFVDQLPLVHTIGDAASEDVQSQVRAVFDAHPSRTEIPKASRTAIPEAKTDSLSPVERNLKKLSEQLPN